MIASAESRLQKCEASQVLLFVTIACRFSRFVRLVRETDQCRKTLPRSLDASKDYSYTTACCVFSKKIWLIFRSLSGGEARRGCIKDLIRNSGTVTTVRYETTVRLYTCMVTLIDPKERQHCTGILICRCDCQGEGEDGL